MGKVETIIKTNDEEKIRFYLEYVVILIEFFEKRNKTVKELYNEKKILENKLEELS